MKVAASSVSSLAWRTGPTTTRPLNSWRILALNKPESWIKKEGLSRIIPRRRKRQETRPGPRGKDPMGREIGSQEQWIFPEGILTDEDKKRILGAVIRITVELLFSTHLYTFGGDVFLQQLGGPIGLRATCAVRW